jgi:hypothetical protein
MPPGAKKVDFVAMTPEQQREYIVKFNCDSACLEPTNKCAVTPESKAKSQALSTELKAITDKWDGKAAAPLSDVQVCVCQCPCLLLCVSDFDCDFDCDFACDLWYVCVCVLMWRSWVRSIK